MVRLLALTLPTDVVPRHTGRRQRGVSLIEFLVVLVIITIGLLSVAGMLAYGIKQDQETVFRTLAASQAEDLAERMHTNALGASAGFYANGFYESNKSNPAAAVGTVCASATAAPPCCPIGTSAPRCTEAAVIAVRDRVAWASATATLLPLATASAVLEAAGTYAISVGWTEAVRRQGDNVTTLTTVTPTPQTLTFRYQSIPEVSLR